MKKNSKTAKGGERRGGTGKGKGRRRGKKGGQGRITWWTESEMGGGRGEARARGGKKVASNTWGRRGVGWGGGLEGTNKCPTCTGYHQRQAGHVSPLPGEPRSGLGECNCNREEGTQGILLFCFQDLCIPLPGGPGNVDFHFALNGKSYQVLLKYFTSWLPKVSGGGGESKGVVRCLSI